MVDNDLLRFNNAILLSSGVRTTFKQLQNSQVVQLDLSQYLNVKCAKPTIIVAKLKKKYPLKVVSNIFESVDIYIKLDYYIFQTFK